MQKIYVLDTNVLMYEPKSLFAFEDNEVVLPLIVLDELDKKKTDQDQAARHARQVIRLLDEMRVLGNISTGVTNERGGIIRVEVAHKDNIHTDLDPNRADNRIISVALGLAAANPDKKVAVITKDINLRVKCDALGVHAEDFTSDSVVANIDEIYSGMIDLEVDDTDIDAIYTEEVIPVKNIVRPLFPNEYVHLRSNINPKHTAMARFNGTMLEKVRNYKDIWGISPRNKEQVFALDALFNPDIQLVTMTGLAGAGKTLLAVAAGISQLFDAKIYKRLILTRPIQPLGRDLGYLPGDLNEKMAPWVAPLVDNLELIFSEKGKMFLDDCMEKGQIQVEPITYIRGRSIPKSFIIVDEAQNLTKHEIKTIITRCGEGSKVCLTGDIQQIDVPYLDGVDNGLSCVIEKFKDDLIAAHVTLMKGERSELANKAAQKL